MSIYDVRKMYIYYNCSASGPPGRPPVAESGHVLYFFPQSVPFSIIRKRCIHVALHCHTDRRDRFVVLSQDHNLLLHHIRLFHLIQPLSFCSLPFLRDGLPAEDL